MIKIKSINGEPEQKPPLNCGSHYDGEYYYYFDNVEEHENFLLTLPQPEVVDVPQVSPIIETILQATPEEIKQIKQILGIM